MDPNARLNALTTRNTNDWLVARFAVVVLTVVSLFFFSSRRRHTRFDCDWSSDVCSSDLWAARPALSAVARVPGWRGHQRQGHHNRPDGQRRDLEEAGSVSEKDCQRGGQQIGRASCRERV